MARNIILYKNKIDEAVIGGTLKKPEMYPDGKGTGNDIYSDDDLIPGEGHNVTIEKSNITNLYILTNRIEKINIVNSGIKFLYLKEILKEEKTDFKFDLKTTIDNFCLNYQYFDRRTHSWRNLLETQNIGAGEIRTEYFVIPVEKTREVLGKNYLNKAVTHKGILNLLRRNERRSFEDRETPYEY